MGCQAKYQFHFCMNRLSLQELCFSISRGKTFLKHHQDSLFKSGLPASAQPPWHHHNHVTFLSFCACREEVLFFTWKGEAAILCLGTGNHWRQGSWLPSWQQRWIQGSWYQNGKKEIQWWGSIDSLRFKGEKKKNNKTIQQNSKDALVYFIVFVSVICKITLRD